jgi:hypothetical protein
MYPMAITFMPVRLLLLVLTFFVTFIITKILLRNKDISSPDYVYNNSTKFVVTCFSYTVCLLFGVVPTSKLKDVDYAHWLGPDYRKK